MSNNDYTGSIVDAVNATSWLSILRVNTNWYDNSWANLDKFLNSLLSIPDNAEQKFLDARGLASTAKNFKETRDMFTPFSSNWRLYHGRFLEYMNLARNELLD